MPLSRDEFTQQLTASGLLDAAAVTESLANLPPDKQPQDGEQLARELVRQKKLTKFQAEQLYARKGKSLTLGNYVILDKLGQGGMGMVLKAKHTRMGRLVALKVMSPAALKSPDAVKRFHREVQAAAKLEHPNIVTAYDADEAHGTHFLVMQFIEGHDLSELVKTHGPLPTEQAVRCILQAARGLEFAHEQGVIHRDIKPANLLIDKKGTVKILDMGLARIEGAVGGSSAGAGLTSTGTIMGTVDYMSPEQALDTKHADARSDIYSLGCTLYYLLTGKAVYDGDTMMKKLMAHQNGAIPSIVEEQRRLGLRPDPDGSATGRDGVPTYEALDAVFRRMVAKRPEDRPQTMTQVIAELERCLAGGSPTVAFERSADSATTSGASGSGNELQQFLQQISGGESSSAALAGSKVTAVTPSSAEAETMISSAGEGGTDPRTDQTLTIERSGSPSHRKKTLLLGSLAVAVLLLLAAFVMTRPSGNGQIASDGNVLDKSPLKSEPDEPRNRTVGAKQVSADDSQSDPPQYALDFNYQLQTGNARVELPPILRPFEPCTVEMYATPRSVSGVWDNRQLFIVGEGVQLRQQNRNWDWFTPGKDNTYDRVIVEGGVVVGRRMHLAGVSTGKELRLFIDGHLAGKMPVTGDLRVAASACLLGGLAANFEEWKPFDGLIDEVRISKVARYDQNFAPAPRFEADTDTLSVYHFDEGTGDELKDSSGNNNHGKIVGAKWVKTEAADLLRGLIAHWTFDDVSGVKAPDSSGKNHHGTIHGAVIAPGRFGSALNFDGKDDAVSYPKLGTVGDFTYSLWVKHDVAVVAGNLYAALLANDGWSKPGDVHFEYEGGGMTTYVFSTDSQRVTASGFNWSDIAGQWAHLSLVYRANAKAFDFYVNGRRYAGDRPLSSALPKLQLGPGRIGHWDRQDHPDKLGRGFRGLIDDVRVYDRALSESEIRTLASATDRADASITAAAPPPAIAPFDAKQARAHQAAWAKHFGTTVETTNSVGAKMILIPPGEFLMGSSDEQVAAALKVAEEVKADQGVKNLVQNVERPQHKVVITKPFLMSATEVTIGQFKKFAAAMAYQTEAEKEELKARAASPALTAPGTRKPIPTYLNPDFAVTDDSPAAVMTWNDAVAYCQWLSKQDNATYRLPTEAEWEYACRAGTTTQYSFGDEYAELEKFGWYNKNTGSKSHPVGTKLSNAFGLFDMHGNVYEWCDDFWDAKGYEKSPLNDPNSQSASAHRVIRGGSWFRLAADCRSAFRNFAPPSIRDRSSGFRIVRVLDAPVAPQEKTP